MTDKSAHRREFRFGKRRVALVDNWHVVLRKTWSVRFMIIAAFFSALEVAWPYIGSALPISQTVFGLVSGLSVATAFASRFVAQKGLSDADPKDHRK